MANTQSFDDNFQSVTMSNGLRIAHRQTSSPVMYCGFIVDCGTRHEGSPELYGMAHFVEHILFKGTHTRDGWHINNRMESVGGELNAFTTKEDTTFYAVALNKDFARACELLCDLVAHPTAPQHELENEREVVIDEIMSYRDNPAELIFDEFENRLFAAPTQVEDAGNIPPTWSNLGHNILGSEQTVRTFGHDECIRFIKDNYTADRMVFFHQGSTPFDKVVKCIERYFDCPMSTQPQQPSHSPWIIDDKNPPSAASTLLAAEEPWRIEQGTHQSHILLGAPSYPIGSPNSAAMALISNMLGGPGMNSRLGLELREHRGLVYSVDSNISNYTDAGYLGIYFGCDHKDEQRCLKLCHKQLERFKNEMLTPRQLLNAQKQLCGQLGVSRANLENNAIGMAKNLLRLGQVKTLEQNCQRIMALTPEDINRVANEVFNTERLKTAIIC